MNLSFISDTQIIVWPLTTGTWLNGMPNRTARTWVIN
jgi:hypothetical protein